jgi:hypothetical protein
MLEKPLIIGLTFMIFGINKASPRCRITRTLVISFTFAITNLHAANTSIETSWTLETLMQARRSITQSSAEFKEEKFIAAFTKNIHLKGNLIYRSPDHLVKHYTSPEDIRYEVTKNTLQITQQSSDDWEFSQQNINLHEIPSLHAFITAIIGVLSGDIKRIREQFDINFSAKKLHWKITLLPKNELTKKQVSALSISGNAEQVLRIEIKETSGDSTVTNIQPYNTTNTSNTSLQ